ncbi:GPI ethanolamine phosphate transferase 3 [Strongyloides ratti]|uniref:GPI ethanolamine phosphate transferase 3 n=1 Tax=Strongyloides ratti TaxID=34506 RepID=A0A090LGA1_STRRB|nr:GPI ethanolamine phosphate transferase 3 [Strongyloides ratti]CEF67158.1 GPI ethanolamine phosphate transferase 3 [Strongyloides ratti]
MYIPIKWIILSSSYIIALFIFQKGFLLKKPSLDYYSKCEDFRGRAHLCWNKPSFKKAIWIIIDALRYDFLDSGGNLGDEYKGRIKIAKELINDQPNNTILSLFIADPPTTTFQRIKALTTGSLPTFIDMKDNFDAGEIDEDNIINQLILNRYNITFMGDDTWTSLFKNKFNKQFPAPSFDVFDLNTVDNIVLDHLYNEMANDDWNVIIGHFLGVDHCGHRYGPNHSAMLGKLDQMDKMLRDVIKQMDNETILFVMGDHGMSNDGNHGGDSTLEVEAGFLAYSKVPIVHGKRINKFHQIDFVPTFSFLLGIPLPFTNIGVVVETFFPFYELLKLLEINIAQVIRLITAYSREDSGMTTNFQTILQQYNFGTITKFVGDNSALSIVCITVLLVYFYIFSINDSQVLSLNYYFIISYGFFLLFNQTTIPTIPWLAAFVGVPVFITVIFTYNILIKNTHFVPVPLNLALLFGIKMLIICIMCIVHRRHLMLFKVFAPKFIFEAVNFITFLILSTVLSIIYYVKTR